MNEFNGEIKKMMIILSKATLENVYAAFVLANGARMEGIEAEMFFTFFGLEAVHKKKLEHLHAGRLTRHGSTCNHHDEKRNGKS
jgi:peroxiredoxin family protein